MFKMNLQRIQKFTRLEMYVDLLDPTAHGTSHELQLRHSVENFYKL